MDPLYKANDTGGKKAAMRNRNPVLRKMNEDRKNQGKGKLTKTNDLSMVCSPAIFRSTVHGKKLEGSCYTDKVILRIRDEYNREKDPAAKIRETDPTAVWRRLKELLTGCEKEDCWLSEIKDPVLRKQLDRFIFAPDKPPEWKKNPTEWLSNYDILGVLEQYEAAYPEFEFIGPTSIDFDSKLKTGECVEAELCSIDVPKLVRSGKRKIAAVFNLDKHDEPGSHWVSLFVDADAELVFYFDSANNGTPPQINALIDRIQAQIAKDMPTARKNQKFQYVRNKVTHQHNNTECGMYSLFFIITMLTGQSEINKGANTNMNMQDRLNLFAKHRIPDKFMVDYRNKYFNGGARRQSETRTRRARRKSDARTRRARTRRKPGKRRTHKNENVF